jgi:hypothetical protein
MDASDQKKLKLKEKFLRETRLYLILTVYLALFLSSLSTYRKLILEENAISYIHYSYNFIEAMILAKIILIGKFFNLGERFHDRSLIIPATYKTIIFCIFVFAFEILEKFFVGFFEGKSMASIYSEFYTKDVFIMLGVLPIIFFAFIVFFAFLEVDRVLGEGKLFNLFFRRKNSL